VDVFIITFVTCTMTALVVMITGKWTSGAMSTALVASAFNNSIPVVGGWMVAVSSFLFGYSNLVGWSYYGELCFGYIFRSNVLKIYAWIYCGLIFVGAITEVKTVWDYADTMNGLQIFPNLIALIILAPQVAAATRSYFNPTTSKMIEKENLELPPPNSDALKVSEGYIHYFYCTHFSSS
jgi:AGCS family alanine or glycine:cation symporter